MKIFNDFKFEPEMDKVLQSIQCYKSNPAYHSIVDIYNGLLKEAKKLIKLEAAFFMDKKPDKLNIEELKDCRQVIYCLVTLGNEITDVSNKYLDMGQYMKGTILNAIADNVLFDYSAQLYENVVIEASKLGVGLTKRLSPGEGMAIDISFQKDMAELFNMKYPFKIQITEGCMVSPIKSMFFLYGADEKQQMSSVDHDCSMCGNINCTQRLSPYMGKKVLLTVLNGNKECKLEGKTSQSVMSILLENKVYINAPCSGKGVCGKCKIKVIKGRVWLKNNNYKKLTNDEIKNHICLACSTYPLEDCTINIGMALEDGFSIISDYESAEKFPENVTSGFEIHSISVKNEKIGNNKSLTEDFNEQIGERYNYSLNTLKKISGMINNCDGQNFNLVTKGKNVIDIILKCEKVLGIGIDIGTTTIVLSLVDLIHGKVLKVYSMLNSQRRFGADVISRIEYSKTHINGVKECIVTDILKSIDNLCGELKHNVYHIAISGNTTMLYMLLGLPCESLAFYPFKTVTVDFIKARFRDIFEDDSIDCDVTILPGASAYIGADIVSGMFKCGFNDTDKISMLIDIGTNGEMVIGNNKNILCLATAAGPAFEGTNISCGTGSVKGAICSVSIQNGNVECKTISGGDALGICGSGVIDIVSSALKEGMIDKTGRIVKEICGDNYIKIAENSKRELIYFSQKDVREFQLAKSAIVSGIEILIENYGCEYDDIDTVYIGGGFGSKINIENAVRVGLIPQKLQSKIKACGNTSLGGTIYYLLNEKSEDVLDHLKNTCNFIDISSDNKFNSLFIHNMNFDS